MFAKMYSGRKTIQESLLKNSEKRSLFFRCSCWLDGAKHIKKKAELGEKCEQSAGLFGPAAGALTALEKLQGESENKIALMLKRFSLKKKKMSSCVLTWGNCCCCCTNPCNRLLRWDGERFCEWPQKVKGTVANTTAQRCPKVLHRVPGRNGERYSVLLVLWLSGWRLLRLKYLSHCWMDCHEIWLLDVHVTHRMNRHNFDYLLTFHLGLNRSKLDFTLP